MAAPSYTTDLLPITTAESGTWGEITGYASGGTPTLETDYYIQGTGCYSQSTGGKTGLVVSMWVDYGSDLAASITTGKCVFFWQIVTAGNAMDTFANGGLRLGIGSAAGDFKMWISGGKDFGRNPYGGWQNVAIDPRYNSSTPDYTIGTPSAVWRYFASQPNFLSAIGKGSPHALDAVRYGRGEVKIEYGTSVDGYGTFSGIATENDNTTNRWGLLQTEGTGYLWKGLLSFGNATNACQFVDSNRNITVDNTPRTNSTFNKINITNASSIVTWTNVNFIALLSSQLSRGDFEMIDNAAVTLTGCSFTDLNTFIFNSNATITDTTFRRCGQITSGGATFSGCRVTSSTSAVSVAASSPSDIEDFTDCTFVSDGGNHAIDLGTVSSSISYNWNNTLTGYAASDGSSGNEALKVSVASGQTLTINVGTGYSSPSIYNTGSGSVSVVSGQVTATITVKDLSTGLPILGANVLVWVTGSPPANYFYQASVSITGSGTTATVTQSSHGLTTGDYVIIEGVTNDDDYNGVFQVTVSDTSTYTYTTSETLGVSPATGTPIATFALISGTTDSNGEVSDTRSLSNDAMTISGWARKSSASPYYQQGVISGTVSNATGFSTTVQLARDE